MCQMHYKKKNKGFSLVELVVVILVLGILTVATTPQIMKWIDKSKAGKDEAYASEVATVVETHVLEYIGKNTLDSNEAVYTLTDTVEKTSGGGSQDLSTDMISWIGADRCRKPEESDKTKFVIRIIPEGTTATVQVTAE